MTGFGLPPPTTLSLVCTESLACTALPAPTTCMQGMQGQQAAPLGIVSGHVSKAVCPLHQPAEPAQQFKQFLAADSSDNQKVNTHCFCKTRHLREAGTALLLVLASCTRLHIALQTGVLLSQQTTNITVDLRTAAGIQQWTEA